MADCECGPQTLPVPGPIGTFAGFTASTPVLPAMYWDVYSAEQRWKTMCCNLKKLIEYSESIATEVNNISAGQTDLIEEKINELLVPINTRLAILEEALNTLINSLVVYDPTKGVYTNSVNQSRRMMQILSTPNDSMRSVAATSTMTVDEFGKYMCGEYVNASFKHYLNETIPYQSVKGDSIPEYKGNEQADGIAYADGDVFHNA